MIFYLLRCPLENLEIHLKKQSLSRKNDETILKVPILPFALKLLKINWQKSNAKVPAGTILRNRWRIKLTSIGAQKTSYKTFMRWQKLPILTLASNTIIKKTDPFCGQKMLCTFGGKIYRKKLSFWQKRITEATACLEVPHLQFMDIRLQQNHVSLTL